MYLLEAKKKAEREAALEKRKAAQKRIHENQNAGNIARAKAAMDQAERARKQKEAQEEAELERAIAASRIKGGSGGNVGGGGSKEGGGGGRGAASHSAGSDRVIPVAKSGGGGADNFGWEDAQVGCKYVGTFEVGNGKIDRNAVKRGVAAMKEYAGHGRDATLIICLEGIKVVDTHTHKVAMAHALARISMCSVDPHSALFGFVAKNPGVTDKFCHVFSMRKQRHADDVHALVSKAFKLAFTKERTVRAGKGKSRTALPGASAGGGAARPAAAEAGAAAQPGGGRKRNWAKHNPLQGMATPVAGAARPSSMAVPSSAGAAAMVASPAPVRKNGNSRNGSNSSTGGDSGGGLRATAWYQAGIPREVAMELLEMSENGAFIVRDSQSQPGNFALTMKADGLMHHFIIRSTPKGMVLGSHESGQPVFPDLGTLIVQYCHEKGCLPCTLSLDSFNALFEDDKAPEEHVESYVDPDYQSLKQLRAQMGR